MATSITQDMKYRQSLTKYADKYGVSRASRKYNQSRSYIAPIPGLTDRKNSRKLKRKGVRTMEQTKKGTPPPQYDEAFKAGAVRLVTE